MISVYLFKWNRIVDLLKGILKTNFSLYIFQIVISGIPTFLLVIEYCIGIIFAIYYDFMIVSCLCNCTFLCEYGLCLNLDDLMRIAENEYKKGIGRFKWIIFENWYCCQKSESCIHCTKCYCCDLTSLWHDYNYEWKCGKYKIIIK